ncbi:MAG TPA: helix-turn-helix domain-containing protein [Solirubrobacterales bacterium]|nr:helix-turn-helix domain-containing protein [Solirubrobacterales bacterium]
MDFVEAGDGRLSTRLAETLDPKLQDALDHPVRREVLRTLNRSGRSRAVSELGVELNGFPLSQLNYHLQVLAQLGTVGADSTHLRFGQAHAHYASEVSDRKEVLVVLRATERLDRERRQAAASASAPSHLTMFRVPRPTRTIRLRGRSKDNP